MSLYKENIYLRFIDWIVNIPKSVSKHGFIVYILGVFIAGILIFITLIPTIFAMIIEDLYYRYKSDREFEEK